MRWTILLLGLFAGCESQAPARQPLPRPVQVAPPMVVEPPAKAPAALIPPPAPQPTVQVQAPPPALPSSLTVVIAGNSWRGGSLDGTYTLSQNSNIPTWSFDLPAPIGGVTRIEASYTGNGLGQRRLTVGAYEYLGLPNQPDYCRHGWCRVNPPTPTGWSGTVCDGRVGNAGGSICPVLGTASVTAN